MISFALDEIETLIQETARKLAAERLWPMLRETEADRGLGSDLCREVHELGLTLLDLPEEVGGQGLGRFARCLVEEQLAFGDPAACFALGGPGALGPMVRALGTPEQIRTALAPYGAADGYGRRGALAFSEARPADRAGMGTRAAGEAGGGYRIRGDKAFVVNGGVADQYVVVAQVEADRGVDGLGAFLVGGDAEGVRPGPRLRPLGLDAVHVAHVTFDVVVPESARLLGGDDFNGALAAAFADHALVQAARAVGLASRAFQLTRDFCGERQAFGKPIAHFQAVAFNVADRLMDVEASRWLVWRAAAEWDRKGVPCLADVAGAAAHAHEAAMRTSEDGIQLHGGAGFVRDFPIEKLFRDARQLSLMGTSVATLDQWAAAEELGRGADATTWLPIGDIQPVYT